MPVEVILPKVDMDMTHGTLAVWHVAEGDLVEQGQPLFDIETDKAAMEVEAPASGRLQHISAKAGDKVPVGVTIAWLYAEGEAVGDAPGGAAPVAAVAVVADTPPDPRVIEVILPKVDMDMTHGTLAVWHAAEGERVREGQALFDIETDKAAMEVESPASGTLQFVSAAKGDRIAVGAVVAYIYPEGVAVGARPAPAPKAAPVAEAARPVVPQPVRPQEVGEGQRATPAARAAARAAGTTLAEISGTGPRGRIQRDDVTAFLDSCNEATPVPAESGWTPEAGPLHITRRKGEGVPIVLIHGFTADGQSWSPMERALGASRPVIRIDLPGHGKSPKRRIESFAKLARMLVDAFDEATREYGKVHLVGHSLGGALAAAIADIRGRRLAGLTLIAPAGLGPEINAAALNGIVRASRTESLLPWLRQLTGTPAAIDEDYARAAMKTRMDPALRACQADMAASLFPDGVQAFDLRAALARLDCPTAIIWGRQDHILPHRHALALDGDFGIYLLAGAGHIPHIECPERVARIVARQLAGAEAPV